MVLQVILRQASYQRMKPDELAGVQMERCLGIYTD
jgi:hypothetical protein